MDTCIVIRTGIIINNKLYVQAGGVVYDSSPQKEYIETVNKAKAVLNAAAIVLETKMILLIDNYDSFTYNLVHYVEDLGHSVNVYRNDKISLKKLIKLVQKIIISPGPLHQLRLVAVLI